MAGHWRDAASLIILAKTTVSNCHNYNYRIATFTRSKRSSYMPDAVVFPGGVIDSCDQCKAWLTYFKECGVTDSKIANLSNITGDRPGVFERESNIVKREVSLRIAAIRETFEELGVLICQKEKDINEKTQLDPNIAKGLDIAKWQKTIHNSPDLFLQFCRKFSVVPAIWNLHEWGAWLTPISYPKRFETAFFIVSLPGESSLLPEAGEVEQASWETPGGLLIKYKSGKLWLPPPQHYEFTRLAQYRSSSDIIKFAEERSKLGSTLMLPVQFQCSNGLLVVFPGDEFYPSNPFKHDKSDMKQYANLTLEHLRSEAKKLHRAEHRSLNDVQYFMNIPPLNGHIGVCDF